MVALQSNLEKCAILSIKAIKEKWGQQNMVPSTKERESVDQRAGLWKTFLNVTRENLWYKRECTLVILSIDIYMNNKSKDSLSIYW